MADTRTTLQTTLLGGLVAVLVVAGATIGFHDLFLDNGWIRPVAVAIVGGAGLGTLWRLLGLPTVPRVVLTLGLGIAWLLAWYPLATGVAWSRRPAVLLDGLTLARQEIAQQVAPTPFLTGLSLVVVAGAFLVALVVAELLARRLVLSALMAGIVLWVAPLTIPLEERSLALSALAFTIPAVLALALLDDPSTGAGGSAWPRRLRGLAGALAVVVLAIPLARITPGHGASPVFDLRGWGTTIEGYEPIVDVGDQLRLPEPRRVMEVTTDRPAYLRTAALEVFDGRRWRVGTGLEETDIPASAYDDPSDGIGRRRGADDLTTYEINALDLPNVYLPVPNRPVQVTTTGGPAGLTYSSVGEFVATDSMDALLAATGGADYVAQVALPAPQYDDLVEMGEIPRTGTSLTTDLPVPEPAIADLAREVVAAADAATTIDEVLAVQDHLAGPDSEFVYSTDVPELRGDDALNDFVFTTRTGYCEYFATTMTVMLRSLDIPSRVATGYLPGEEITPPGPNGEPGEYAVSSSDAHAWVEVNFPEFGWVTFDPTPRSDTAGLRPQASDLTPFGALRGDNLPQNDPQGFAGFNPLDLEPTNGPGQSAGNTGGLPVPIGGRVVGTVSWVLVGLLALVAAALAWLWWRARTVPTAEDPTESGLLALSHLLVSAAALGEGRRRSETLHEVTRRWVERAGVDRDDALAIADLGGQAGFGGHLSPDESARLRSACERVTTHLHDRATLSDRMLATPRRIRSTP